MRKCLLTIVIIQKKRTILKLKYCKEKIPRFNTFMISKNINKPELIRLLKAMNKQLKI